MTRDEKIHAVREHAADLAEAASNYARCAIVAEKLPEGVLDAMYELSLAHDQLHQMFADIIEEATAK